MSNFARSQPRLDCRLLSLCLLLFQPCSANAAASRERQPAKGESVRISAEAIHIQHAPTLDATLNDPLWHSVKPVTGFGQREPPEGKPPTNNPDFPIPSSPHPLPFRLHRYTSTHPPPS